jgi:hypothetical protein
MNLFRNKFLIGLICIALGLAVGFLAIPKLKGKDSLEHVKAIRLRQTVPEGTLITDDMVESIEINPSLIPADTITDLALVINRYSQVPIFSGDYLTLEKLTDELNALDPMAVATTKGLKVVSITLPSLAAGVSGQLKPGDIVTIMASGKQSLADQTQTLNPKEQSQTRPVPLVSIPMQLRLKPMFSQSFSMSRFAHSLQQMDVRPMSAKPLLTMKRTSCRSQSHFSSRKPRRSDWRILNSAVKSI